LDLVGTLRGAETVPLVKLADKIDSRLEEKAPMFRIELIAMMVSLFQSFWRVDQLPHAVRDLFANRKLSYVESSALSALLERKISEPVYPQDEDDELANASGIPPPENLFEAQNAAA
jgi:hypothetical protein